GGVICAACGAPPQGPYDPRTRAGWLPLSLPALKLLRFMQRNAFAQVAALTISPRTHTEVEFLMARYITILLERQLKSVDFLKLIRRADLPALSSAVVV